MKKTNWCVYALLALVSAFLLWLWYHLGFDRVDAPFDLVLSVIWWVMIATFAWLTHRSEQRREHAIRTVYVYDDGTLFNSELGSVDCADASGRVDSIQSMLGQLRYGFKMEDMPGKDNGDGDEPRCLFVIETDKFDGDDDDSDDASTDDDFDWTGTVTELYRDMDGKPCTVRTDFDGKDELRAAISKAQDAQA